MHNLTSRLVLVFVIIWAIATGSAEAQSLSVSYHNDLITIRCNNASLEQVFDQIRTATGMELFLEDPVKAKRLTAQIDSQPLNLAVERLLAGAGVNYAMMYDREDWKQVAKLFIGEGGGPLASNQPAAPANARRPARIAAPAEDNYDPTEEFEDVYAEDEPVEEFVDDENAYADEEQDPFGSIEEPDAQGYLPAPPAFPRSRFTPGLESSPFGNTQQSGTGTGANSNSNSNSNSRPNRPTRPPAYYPFTDQFGRPIPVPPNPNEQPVDEETPEEVPEDQQ